MINEDKVILMTKLAAYEQHEKKKNMAVGNYFRSDYMGLQMSAERLHMCFCLDYIFFMILRCLCRISTRWMSSPLENRF
mgnify:CR=1 FL=1